MGPSTVHTAHHQHHHLHHQYYHLLCLHSHHQFFLYPYPEPLGSLCHRLHTTCSATTTTIGWSLFLASYSTYPLYRRKRKRSFPWTIERHSASAEIDSRLSTRTDVSLTMPLLKPVKLLLNTAKDLGNLVAKCQHLLFRTRVHQVFQEV